ncbi:MAG: hypothetical protein ACRDK4_15335 [Solirubrobacteraceae bacterium]
MQFDREFEIPLWLTHARVLVRTGGQPIHTYAVLLQIEHDEQWTTVRLIDNHLDRHHMHRYDGDSKQDAEQFAVGDVSKVLPDAICYLTKTASAIILSWERSL